jgi:hypothetical protein
VQWNDAKERYVWFHQSENNSEESSLDSFFILMELKVFQENIKLL